MRKFYYIAHICAIFFLTANLQNIKTAQASAIIQTSSILPIEAELNKIDSTYIVLIDFDAILIPSQNEMRDKKLFKRIFNKLVKENAVKKEQWKKVSKSVKELADKKWPKTIQKLLDKEVRVIIFTFENNIHELKAYEINTKENLALKKNQEIKISRKNLNEIESKVIIITPRRKILDSITNHKITKIEYTYLANLPKLDHETIAKYILNKAHNNNHHNKNS